jgi:inorganic pyrophosphatase
MNFNPWHSVSFGKHAPQIVNGIIEIPKGSRAKYELDKESGLLKLDRVLYSSVYYPANYGFIPQTYCDDKDPLDILILSQVQIVPLCIVPARVIGVMRMIDGGEADDKIIAVAADDISVSHVDDISKLPAMFMEEIRHFFEEYKRLENKTVRVEEFQDAKTAQRIILQAIDDYKAMNTNSKPVKRGTIHDIPELVAAGVQ